VRKLTEPESEAGMIPDTSEECLILAAAAMVQAETQVSMRDPRLDMVHACVAIANAWTALGRGLQGEPQLLTTSSFVEQWKAQGDREQQPAIVLEKPTPMFDAVSGELESQIPDHAHSPDCRHTFDEGRMSCSACGQGPASLTWRCPVPCPEPGPVAEADPDARW
jgi:hypothetical protein